MRYFWLKLQQDFFTSLPIKKLYSLDDGAEAILLYQKLLLLTLNTDGHLNFYGIEEHIEEELALQLLTPIKIVKSTIDQLIHMGLILRLDNGSLQVTDYANYVGSESESAGKMRKKRARDKSLVTEQSHTSHNMTIDKIIKEEDTDIKTDLEKKTTHSSPSSQSYTTAKEVISYLNSKSGSSYSPDDLTTISLISALLDQGFTLENFRAVIDKKVPEWIQDPKSSAWLRPTTLFGPKFQSYLNQPLPIRKNMVENNHSHINVFDAINLS